MSTRPREPAASKSLRATTPNDFEVGRRHNLEVINILNDNGSLNLRAGERFAGMDRFAARKLCVELMEAEGLLEKIDEIVHAVGYSERGDVPIETIASHQWFCNMKELAKPAIEAVKSGEIQFHPERWSKTYFHWMENIQDWCISRQIWWGHRIPAWYNDETGDMHVGLEAPTAPRKVAAGRRGTSSTPGSAAGSGPSPSWAGPGKPTSSSTSTPPMTLSPAPTSSSSGSPA